MPRRESGQSEASREERFREIFFEYHRPVVSFFQRRGSTYEESLDLAQETFLRIFKGMEGFRGESSLGTWVYTIASHSGFGFPEEVFFRHPSFRGSLRSQSFAAAQLARLSEDDVRARLVEVAARLGRSIDQLGDPDVVEACIEAVKGRRR